MNRLLDANDSSISLGAEPNDSAISLEGEEVPRDLLRDVAAQMKSLSRVLPYPEYAAIVQRIARLKWRCMLGDAPRSNIPRPEWTAKTRNGDAPNDDCFSE